MSDTTVVETTDETQTVDWEARALKAEAKIVKDKKAEPSTTETTTDEVKTEEVKAPDTQNFMTKDDFEANEFFKDNKDLAEHKEALTEIVSRGNSWEDAKYLLEKKDPTILNRKTTKQSNFTTWDTPKTDYTFTEAQLWDDNLSQDDYNKMMKLVDEGKAKITA